MIPVPAPEVRHDPIPLAAVAALFVAGPVAAADRPNVLVVLTDDMRWDALGVVQKEQGTYTP